MKKTSIWSLASLGLATILIITACGGDDNGNNSPPITGDTSSSSSSSETMPSSSDVSPLLSSSNTLSSSSNQLSSSSEAQCVPDYGQMLTPGSQYCPSSSSTTQSSSSVTLSSSSIVPSSSSVVQSSSSVIQSSSSVTPSSSSVIPSSSSQQQSSSSSWQNCNGNLYNPALQFCQTGTNAVKDLCGGTETYTASQFCQEGTNMVKWLCSYRTPTYELVYLREYSQSEYCSETTIKEYGSTPTIGGRTYKTVVIGTQTWMAENLDYYIEGSKCYNNDESNCAKYGRLYDWSTAMALPSSCNTSSCNSLIQILAPGHRGICPSGWHIPRNIEWDRLLNYASDVYGSVAGLKARSGWNDYSGRDGNGVDYFGFTALPGGWADNVIGFYDVGYNGIWRSANEHCVNTGAGLICGGKAYYKIISSSNEDRWGYSTSGGHFYSVRCVMD